jgi:putative endonuclease
LVDATGGLGLHLDQSQEWDTLHRRDINLAQRIYDHRRGMGSEFTRRYRMYRLVYVEAHATMPLPIAREKRLKTWNRAWKVRLINKDNPDWEDLFERIVA